MDLEFIDKEISESRLYRTSGAMSQLNGRDVADLIYLNTIALYMMLQDDVQHEYASAYATQTAQYGNYNLFRTHATDLYMLCHIINKPEDSRLSSRTESIKFLKGLSFNQLNHIRFMRTISKSADSTNEAISYFFRLETQLKIKNGQYLQFRRYITTWGNLKYSSRQVAVTKILQQIRKLGRGSELILPLSTMTKYKKFTVEPEYSRPRTSFAKKVAGAAIGAVAGRYIAGKAADMDKEKLKKAGTGLGAIAGYWAAGRKKKQI